MKEHRKINAQVAPRRTRLQSTHKEKLKRLVLAANGTFASSSGNIGLQFCTSVTMGIMSDACKPMTWRVSPKNLVRRAKF
jgi:hypothetical protein